MSESSRLPQITRSRISERVYRVLKRQILRKQFAPGERLNLAEMSQQMKVSRTPLNTALHRLAIEGLIEIIPHSGTYITDPTPKDIEEAFDVRRVLESDAAELTAQRVTVPQLERLRDMVGEARELASGADRATAYQEYLELDHGFHRLIVEFSGNEQLNKLWEQVNVHVQAARIRYKRTYKELDLDLTEHDAILKALTDGSSPGVRHWLEHHIERSKQALLRDWTGVASS
jgi:DNA-binding GntR family transcriptional regulator